MIALLIPCYNAEVFLPRLLADVNSQTIPFAEIICYDDGSSDRTGEVARAHGCRIIRSEENHGPAYARNRLFQAATAPWVHFHDADDRMHQRFVEAFTARIAQVATANTAWFCAIRRLNPSIAWQEEVRYGHLAPDTDWLGFHLTSFISHIQMVFPRSALIAAGGYDERLVSGEDVNLHIRLAAAGLRFQYLDELLVEQNCGDPASLGNSTAQARKLRDTLVSCVALRPRLPERYWPQILATTSTLAVHFSSLQLRAEMETAIAETIALCPPRRVPQSRPAMRFATQLLGFPLTCRLRYRLIGARDLLGHARGRTTTQPRR